MFEYLILAWMLSLLVILFQYRGRLGILKRLFQPKQRNKNITLSENSKRKIICQNFCGRYSRPYLSTCNDSWGRLEALLKTALVGPSYCLQGFDW